MSEEVICIDCGHESRFHDLVDPDDEPPRFYCHHQDHWVPKRLFERDPKEFDYLGTWCCFGERSMIPNSEPSFNKPKMKRFELFKQNLLKLFKLA